jgi:hypothetical protein
MIRNVLAALLAAAGLICASPAQAAFASLAFSPSTGEVSATHDATSRAQSERDALTNCKSTDCKIIFTTQAKWMAIAVSGAHTWGVSDGDERNPTMIAAYQSCLKTSATCHWRLWTHNSGDAGKDETNEFSAGPAIHPKLAAIGGAFSMQIPNFKGFAQLHPNLCWAAALKTLYYNMSGFELSQWKLARLTPVLDSYGVEASDQAVLELNDTVGQCNATVKSGCKGGSPVAAAQRMGILLPLNAYPKTGDGVGIYRSIRRSLQAGFPAIISIDWYTGQTHALVVWGATFSARPGSAAGDASIVLNVYDPENDSFSRMTSNAYLPQYEVVPGRFTGMTTFANFLNPAVKNPDGAGKQVCEFLNSGDRQRACKD